MSDFTAIGQLVTEARNLLDSIKGGAIRTMQTQFDALKVQLNDVINGANGRLNTFITQQQQNVSTIFAEPDKRYKVNLSNVENKTVLDLSHLDGDKFYCVRFDRPIMLDVRIKRYVHQDEPGGGILEYFVQLQNFSNGGDFHFAKQLHHRYTKREFVGKVLAASTPYTSGIWLRGGWTYDLFVSGTMGKEPIKVIETDTDVADEYHGTTHFAPPISAVHSSVVPNSYISGV
ncbi:conserved hypothetical protein [Vibrio crassostreae]|nr:conserved hypothetical protein [Vibrio crassostreae]CAK2829074.1 conserved hypothetical protein [Vibrio crassostreae]CAK2832648.1 conserved hypothetical protein [Vibrio crassostreae]CAK2860201.1 conserved hypothetical protein [Vibrio crassostreae]CAK2895374.1 conserved hypothetical protein [Vibrio crassostreae]